ncbi:MAG: hypothetical protein JWN04_1811 [Myxococcaceae bacterium]|nr:hypothetical protein [Myxococcaceae bacterium]
MLSRDCTAVEVAKMISQARSQIAVEETKLRARAFKTARILLGVLLVVNAPVGTLLPIPSAGPEGDALMAALWASPWIMILTKLIELGSGIAFLSGRYVPLALVAFAPVLVNIIAFQATYSPRVLPVGLLLLTLAGATAWRNHGAMAGLFRAKASS